MTPVQMLSSLFETGQQTRPAAKTSSGFMVLQDRGRAHWLQPSPTFSVNLDNWGRFYSLTITSPKEVTPPTTLAYQLRSRNPQIGDAIAAAVENTPNISISPLRLQFMKLIIQPMSSTSISLNSRLDGTFDESLTTCSVVPLSGVKTIRVLDIPLGAETLPHIREHSHDVRPVAFSPAGDIIASGSGDKQVRIWDVVSGPADNIWTGAQVLEHLERHSVTILSSPDGTVRDRDSALGQELMSLSGRAGMPQYTSVVRTSVLYLVRVMLPSACGMGQVAKFSNPSRVTSIGSHQ
jgi:hypothetical protein